MLEDQIKNLSIIKKEATENMTAKKSHIQKKDNKKDEKDDKKGKKDRDRKDRDKDRDKDKDYKKRKKKLASYLKQFKQARDIFMSALGKGLIDAFVEQTDEYIALTTDDESLPI